MTARSLAFALIFGLIATRAPAQVLTLSDAQAEARAHAPQAAELEAVIRGAEALAAQAGRRFRQNPEVSGTSFNGALTGRSP